MKNDPVSIEQLLELISRSDLSLLEKWDAIDAQFARDVDAFVANAVPDVLELGDHQNLGDLQRRMLRFLLVSVEIDSVTTPAELAEGLGVRNRRLIRAAGRHLAGKGLVIAETEPSDTPEGETVLGYSVAASVQTALETYLDEQAELREAACSDEVALQ